PMPNGLAEDEVYVPIYFPTTPDGSRALAVDLPRGSEYQGVDINLTPTHAYHVRGVVQNPPPPPTPGAGRGAAIAGGAPPTPATPPGAPGAQAPARPIPQTPIRLTPTTPNGSIYATGIDATTGAFDFPKVVPGGYVSYLFLDGLTVRTPVEVRSSDVDAV